MSHDTPGDEPTVTGSSTSPEQTIGPYALRRLIGSGGMGEVWLADQQQPVRRRVAIKVIKLGMDTREVVARFELERQAIAVMEHPGIARMFDAGVTTEGRPYFVMEYVGGEPIHAYCDRVRLPLRARLALFLQICSAAQHAHQKAIIHRDLKPSNILVVEQDGHPVPKIIDFGIAKATAGHWRTVTLATQYGALVGTPEYMSPEQVEGSDDVDTRSDVYSLGVLLYELLAGAHPSELQSARTIDDVRRLLREQDPSPPSTRSRNAADAERVAHMRGMTPAQLSQALRGDLNAIVLKALEKDRNRRYGSCADFAADIERHLRAEPVLAHPPSTLYRARRFVRRHRFGVIAAGAATLLLMAFSIGMALFASRLARERDRANRQVEITQRTTTFLKELFQSATPERTQGAQITARELLDRGAARIAEIPEEQWEVRAELAQTMGGAYEKLGLYAAADKLLRESFEFRRRMDGAYSPATLSSAASWGYTMVLQGRFEEAIALLQPMLSGMPEPATHDHTWNAAAKALAIAFTRRRQYTQAEPLLQRLVESERKAHGSLDSETLVAMNNLSLLYGEQGRLADGARLDEEVLAARRLQLGANHPLTLVSMNNLAVKYGGLRRFDDARQLLRDAISAGERVMGADHPETATYVHSLAEVEMAGGNFSQAERLLLRVVSAYRRQAAHQFLPLALYELAQAQAAQGHGHAVRPLREALEAGYKPPASPREDPHFGPIRDSAEFRRAIVAPAAKR